MEWSRKDLGLIELLASLRSRRRIGSRYIPKHTHTHTPRTNTTTVTHTHTPLLHLYRYICVCTWCEASTLLHHLLLNFSMVFLCVHTLGNNNLFIHYLRVIMSFQRREKRGLLAYCYTLIWTATTNRPNRDKRLSYICRYMYIRCVYLFGYLLSSFFFKEQHQHSKLASLTLALHTERKQHRIFDARLIRIREWI